MFTVWHYCTWFLTDLIFTVQWARPCSGVGAFLNIVFLQGITWCWGTSLNNYSKHVSIKDLLQLCVCVCLCLCVWVCLCVFPKSSFILNTPLGTIGRTCMVGSHLCDKQVKSLSLQSNVSLIWLFWIVLPWSASFQSSDWTVARFSPFFTQNWIDSRFVSTFCCDIGMHVSPRPIRVCVCVCVCGCVCAHMCFCNETCICISLW